MIYIDNNAHAFERAVNFLNFDKRGNPNGMDSLGILLDINDNETNNLVIFIGLKFDVVSIYTNRGVSLFINLEEKHKTFIGINECYSTDNIEEEIEFYIDVHKFRLNIRQLYSYVYGCNESKLEFSNMLERKIFKTFGRKSARAISMHPTRQFEGNLEVIGFVVSDTKEFFAANELLVPEVSLADEILFTNWFVPRDLKEYDYSGANNSLVFEEGDEFIDGLNGIVLAEDQDVNSFSYDRKGFRSGYMDLETEFPFINIGYKFDDTEFIGTYFTKEKKDTDVETKKTRFTLEKLNLNGWHKRIFNLVHYIAPMSANENHTEQEVLKFIINSIFKIKGKNSWVDIHNMKKTKEIVGIIFENMGVKNKLDSSAHLIEYTFHNTYVQFLYAGNILRSDSVVTRRDISDTIIFIYHPVLTKYFFYEVDGISDPNVIIDNKNNVVITADGFKYGFETDGEVGNFLWSNIEKRYRDIPKEITFTDILSSDPDRELIYEEDPVDPNKSNISAVGTYVTSYDDLVYNEKAAFVLAIKKVDILDIISKQDGVCDSNYAMGMKFGYIEVV